jgi:hypothetical protein
MSTPWVWDNNGSQYCRLDTQSGWLIYSDGTTLPDGGKGWRYDEYRKDYYCYNTKGNLYVYLSGDIYNSSEEVVTQNKWYDTRRKEYYHHNTKDNLFVYSSGYIYRPPGGVEDQNELAETPRATVEEIDDSDEDDSDDESYENEASDEAPVTAVANKVSHMSLVPSNATYGYGYQSQTAQGYQPYTYPANPSGYQHVAPGYQSPYNNTTSESYHPTSHNQNQINTQQSYYDIIPALVQGQREISLDDAIRIFTKIVRIEHNGEHFPGVARLDTAADYNCINYEWARKQGIHRNGESIHNSPGMIMGNGKVAKARRRGFFRWGLRDGEHQWESYFFLMEGLPSDILIGVHEICKVGFMNLLQPSMMDRLGGLCPVFSSKSKSEYSSRTLNTNMIH